MQKILYAPRIPILIIVWGIALCMPGVVIVEWLMKRCNALRSKKDVYKRQLYDCTINVTNSIGDKTSLPVQVEIYADSYEERSLRPSIALKENLIYLKKRCV